MDENNNAHQDYMAVWQTCVEMADSVSQRRDSMNNLFVTLNLALIAAISWMWDIKTVFLCIAGLITSVVWWNYISSFRKLNDAKFQVIHDIEKNLGISPFKKEWEILKQKKHYKEGTILERILPIAFSIGYIAIIVLLVVSV